ncbi:MAG: glycosyltransferase family 2 protein [Thermosphaera sp.]
MPCYNKEYELQRILEAYDRQDSGEKFEIVAIDDGSIDGTLALLSGYQPVHFDLQIHRLTKNSGPAAARNLGISVAKGSLLLFVGDDILPTDNFISQHLVAHENYKETHVAILGFTTWPPDIPINAVMLHIDGVGAEQFSYYYMREGQEYDFRHFYTSNVSIKADFLRSTHPWFDTTFPYAAYEDVELAYRLSKKGLCIIYSSKPKAYHYHYHNVWTFSKRQYRAGLMACHLLKKHPELGTIIRGSSWHLHVVRISALGYYYRQIKHIRLPDEIEKLVLYTASKAEYDLQTQNHELFSRLFRYFFLKGLLHGSKYPAAIKNNTVNYLAISILHTLSSRITT